METDTRPTEKLEVKIETCKNLILEIKGGGRMGINLMEVGNTKTDLSNVYPYQEPANKHLKVICNLTGKNCILYDDKKGRIYLDRAERCPGFESIEQLYQIKGKWGSSDPQFQTHFTATSLEKK